MKNGFFALLLVAVGTSNSAQAVLPGYSIDKTQLDEVSGWLLKNCLLAAYQHQTASENVFYRTTQVSAKSTLNNEGVQSIMIKSVVSPGRSGSRPRSLQTTLGGSPDFRLGRRLLMAEKKLLANLKR